MTSRERVLTALQHREPDRVPFNLRPSEGMRQRLRDEPGDPSSRLVGNGAPGTADRLVGNGAPGTADRLVGTGAEPTLGAPSPPSAPSLPSLPSPPSALGTKEWYSRGYLPHRDCPGLLQMITYRLADSLPAQAVTDLEAELRSLPPERRSLQRRRRIEELADAGHGSCVLRVPQIAELVIENWRHYAGTRYELIAYVAMPNHVHVLVRIYDGVSLPRIVQAWKGYTGKKIKELLAGTADRLVGTGVPGTADRLVGIQAEPTLGAPRLHAPGLSAPGASVWHREFWDRFIRDERHLQAAREYIAQNPVKAGLVARPDDWLWAGC